MKKAHQHTPAKKAAPKLPREQKLLKATAQKDKADKKLTAPIFNTRYQGMPYEYIRPFDPVWPTDEEN